MGSGQILEQGTHSELLRNEQGAYARFVQAQKLRESQEAGVKETDDPPTRVSSENKDVEKALHEEDPFIRKATSRSLASAILNNRPGAEPAEDTYSLWYLFGRMGAINHESWRYYAIGSIFATSAHTVVLTLPRLIKVNDSDRNGVPSIWDRVWFVSSLLLFIPKCEPPSLAKGITGFSIQDHAERRFQGDRNALWFVLSDHASCFVLHL